MIVGNLQVVTPPTEELIPVGDFRAHARIDDAETDDVLRLKIGAAVAYVEAVLRRKLLTQTVRINLYEWVLHPLSVSLPGGRLQSVTSVKYYDTAAVQQTFDSANYIVWSADVPGAVIFRPDATYPELQEYHPAPISIDYIVGYGRPWEVPDPIRDAILMLATHLSEHREPTTTGGIVDNVPYTVDALLQPYRLWCL